VVERRTTENAGACNASASHCTLVLYLPGVGSLEDGMRLRVDDEGTQQEPATGMLVEYTAGCKHFVNIGTTVLLAKISDATLLMLLESQKGRIAETSRPQKRSSRT